MAGGIGEDPERVVAARKAGGAEVEDRCFGGREIADPDVEMRLLGRGRVLNC